MTPAWYECDWTDLILIWRNRNIPNGEINEQNFSNPDIWYDYKEGVGGKMLIQIDKFCWLYYRQHGDEKLPGNQWCQKLPRFSIWYYCVCSYFLLLNEAEWCIYASVK